MVFNLPTLGYSPTDLVPVISEQTLAFHHGKHHQTYVDNLNKLVPGTEYENKSLEEIIKKAPDGPIFNNAAQVWNHTFYFEAFTKPGKPVPALPEIDARFGSFEAFKEEFSKGAVGLFGSGWLWLVKDGEGKLQIVAESNAGNPMRKGLKPILSFDVWEHAYYLDYQNRRAEYIKNLWDILDWKLILKRF
jgi:superoxide dismutase, Fe-Mn family